MDECLNKLLVKNREQFVCIFQISDHLVREFSFAIYFLEILQVTMATYDIWEIFSILSSFIAAQIHCWWEIQRNVENAQKERSSR